MNWLSVTKEEALLRLRIIYPLWIIFGIYGLVYIPSKLFISGDASTTAQAVLSNELPFLLGIISNIIVQLFQITAAFYLYKLFAKVHKEAAISIMILSFFAVPISLVSEMFSYGALLLFQQGSAELGYMFLQLSTFGIQLASIFWGLWLFPIGYLAVKSGYFPKWIGVVVVIAGFGYLLGSFVYVLTGDLHPFFEGLSIGETIFLAYLVILGARLKNN